MREAIYALLVALLAAPLALAEEANETPTRPDDAAWVEDCPPDMMCAANSEEPVPYGNESCIECSGPVRGPEDGSCENCRGDAITQSDGEPSNEVPGLSAGVFGAGLAVAVFLAARRNK